MSVPRITKEDMTGTRDEKGLVGLQGSDQNLDKKNAMPSTPLRRVITAEISGSLSTFASGNGPEWQAYLKAQTHNCNFTNCVAVTVGS
jgi:hypothetical protein